MVHLLVLSGVLAALVVLPQGVSGIEEHPTEWTRVFKGIEYKHLAQSNPNPLAAYAVRIDLRAPGIRFLVTPPSPDGEMEIEGLKTTTFLESFACQVAINASPFAPVGEIEGEPRDVLGLSISEGEIYSQPHGDWAALLITKANEARVAVPPFDTDDIHNAVGGFGLLLDKGENVGVDGNRHPRTAAGVSKDGRYLYLVVIDGRQPGHSVGATTEETAALLESLGAYDALNLDGGGSTTLVFDDGEGNARIVNRPIHRYRPGTERVSGNHLGVFALPTNGED